MGLCGLSARSVVRHIDKCASVVRAPLLWLGFVHGVCVSVEVHDTASLPPLPLSPQTPTKPMLCNLTFGPHHNPLQMNCSRKNKPLQINCSRKNKPLQMNCSRNNKPLQINCSRNNKSSTCSAWRLDWNCCVVLARRKRRARQTKQLQKVSMAL